jgi:hypothetical protein
VLQVQILVFRGDARISNSHAVHKQTLPCVNKRPCGFATGFIY